MNTIYNFYMNMAQEFGFDKEVKTQTDYDYDWRNPECFEFADRRLRLPEIVLNEWLNFGNTLENYNKLEKYLTVERILKSARALMKGVPFKTNIFFLADTQDKIKKYFPDMGKGSDWEWLPFTQQIEKMLYKAFPRYGSCTSIETNFLIYVHNEWSGTTDVDVVWDFFNMRNKYYFTGKLDENDLVLLSSARAFAEDVTKQQQCYY